MPGRVRRGAAWLLVSTAWGLAPGAARAQTATDGPEDLLAVRLPERLTAGGSQQFMGTLSPAEDALYFASDESATVELFVQRPVSAGPRRLFDGAGDVAWPVPSPDGRRVAYVSYVADAAGDACVRPVEGGDERCFGGPGSAALQVAWLDDAHLLVLAREGLHDDFRVVRHAVAGGSPDLVLARNAVGLAVSPDGRWLAYVPLVRRRDDVGVTFANRTARGLHVVPVEGGEAAPAVFEPDLPGVTGYPAFGRDGAHLYFAQYLNDTNRDGAIDGNDNSVVFRVPFDAASGRPAPGAAPEQLTSARWNCHYPSPAATRLVMTCSLGGSLDVYALPLDGAVPREWDSGRLAAEAASARDLWTRLLLLGRLLAVTEAPGARLAILREIAFRHLALREHESARFYAERLAAAPGAAADEVRTGRLLAALAAHRQGDVALSRGQPSRRYVDDERARLVAVRAEAQGAGGEVAALARLVESEIASDLGDKTAALARLAESDLGAVGDPLVLDLADERSRRLHGLLGDREGRLATLAGLAAHPAAPVADRLRHARAFVAEAVRGRGADARRAALGRARAAAPEGGELALVLDVALALEALEADGEEAVRERIFALYRATEDPERRRAIALTTISTASRAGNEYLQYQFATTWASSLRAEDPERKYAEVLFRTVLLERAYGELADADVAEAAAYFFQAGRNSGSLEANVGFVEARIARGDTPAEVEAKYDERFADTPESPVYRFVKAYFRARELPALADPARFEASVDAIAATLAEVARALPRTLEVHHLWGYVLHERALRRGERGPAVDANRQYLLALDLARDTPRARAAILQAVGVLQAELGNHRRALEHLEARARLPFVRPLGELAFRLAHARSLYHARAAARAVAEAEAALALVGAHRALAPHRPLVLDRLAFYALAADDAPAAAARYRELLGALGASAPPVTRLKAEVGLAAASLRAGAPRPALVAIDRAREVLAAGPLRSEGAQAAPRSLLHRYTYGADRYHALLAGLEAQAHLAVDEHDAAERALRARRDALAALAAASGLDEDRRELAAVHHGLARLAARAGRTDEARALLEAGLAHAAAWAESTGTPYDDTRLALVDAYAVLMLDGGLPPSAFARDAAAEARAAYAFVTEFPSPRWAPARARLEVHLTRLALRAQGAPSGTVP